MDAEMKFERWMELPPELQVHILSYLALSDIPNVAVCSTYMRTLTLNDALWNSLRADICANVPKPDTAPASNDSQPRLGGPRAAQPYRAPTKASPGATKGSADQTARGRF